MKHLALSLSLAALALPAAAGTYYIPNPDNGGLARAETKLEVTQGGPRRFAPVFIDTGIDGSGATGSEVNVDNDSKPNVFDVTRFIRGAGMLKLQGVGMQVRTGVLFLPQGDDTVTWALPVLAEDNWFKAGETAHIQGLARNADGHSNLELLNFASADANCNVKLLRPKGSPLAPTDKVKLFPLSHRLMDDPFEGLLSLPAAAGLRAEVSCNQPFYAYGTFVGERARDFRLLYPLDGPPQPVVETVSLNRPNLFFAPTPANSQLTFTLPLVPNRAYRAATIDFDLRISKFTTHFTGLVGMFHTGGQRFNKTLYFGSFVRGLRSRTLVDQGSAVVEPALKFGTGWKEGAVHHVKIVYDTQTATLRMVVSRNDAVIADVTGAAFNLDLAERNGNPVKLNFGLAGVADGAYFPPVGWKFSNLKVRVER
ncbi:MAG TPA: hypothetical protein VGC93_16425 [Thermoanaerobaculia bacterium]